ncbi:MAG: 2OG-Fe(II) oxygenase [Amphiplicatus sp.]
MSAALKLVEPAYPDDDARWRACLARDWGADGAFWSCVSTTGVYCRPSCAGRPLRKNVTFVRTRNEAERAGYRPCKRCRPDRYVEGSVARRLAEIDWPRVEAALAAQGWARLGTLLTEGECANLIEGYADDARYRSTVVMRRHGFGEGEYRYFADPAPTPVKALREGVYPRLAPVASRWMEALGRPRAYPDDHAAYRAQCAGAGQTRPTPLILKYGAGDYNRLHQDLYGGEVFPLQLVVALSEPGKDYDGGAFVLAEQTPRRQSRAESLSLRRGEALVFAVNERPVNGARGTYRVKMRHGLSTVTKGARYALGVIFHDAR